MEDINVVFIREEYFNIHSCFEEMLDPTDRIKQSQRNHLFLNVKYEKNNLLIPFRTEMPNFHAIGKVGYNVPSEEKPNAGLDYRKILIVNDIKYLEMPEYCKIPMSQQKIISSNYEIIKKEVKNYIEGYIKSAKKERQYRDSKYRFSTLHNFHKELGI